jgi:hypothetical protein
MVVRRQPAGCRLLFLAGVRPMFANALRSAATVLIVPLVFGCAGWPSATSPGTASGGSSPTVQETQQRYAQSIADYRACLTANQTGTQGCEAKRLVMEKNETDLDQLLQRRESRPLRASAGQETRRGGSRRISSRFNRRSRNGVTLEAVDCHS